MDGDSSSKLVMLIANKEQNISLALDLLTGYSVCGCRNAIRISLSLMYQLHSSAVVSIDCLGLTAIYVEEAGNLKPTTRGSLIHYSIKQPSRHQSCNDCWPALCTSRKIALGCCIMSAYHNQVESSMPRSIAYRFFKCSNTGHTLMKPLWVSTFKPSCQRLCLAGFDPAGPEQ